MKVGLSKKEVVIERKEMVHQVEGHSSYKPLVYAMLLAGMLFYSAKRSGLRHPKISWSIVYHVCVLFLLWANVIRFFTKYNLGEHFGPNLMGKILLHAFVGKGAVFASACTFMSLRREKVWFAFWKYVGSHGCPEVATQTANRRSKFGVILCFGIIFCVVTNYIYLSIMQPKDVQKIVQFAYFSDSRPLLNIPVLLAVCISIFYAVSATCLALTFLIVLSLDLRDMFLRLTSDLANEVKAEELFQGDLEYYRGRHEQICNIAGHVDEIFSFVTLNVYVINKNDHLYLDY